MTNGAFAFGLGVGTCNAKGDWLEVYFPHPVFNPAQASLPAVDKCHRENPHDNNDVSIDSAATSTIAPRPVRGHCAMRAIRRATTGAVATTYPPITTKAICIVNGIRLQ